MTDNKYINIYDTDAVDPYHEVKNWLRRNEFQQSKDNITLFEEEHNSIKKYLGLKSHEWLTWEDFYSNVDDSIFQ